MNDELNYLRRAVDFLHAELQSEKELCRDLARYVQHRISCEWMQEGGDCTCGLQKVRDRFRTSRNDSSTS